MMTDTIADMLTRIRNAHMRRRDYLEMPTSKMRVSIANILRKEGFIKSLEILEGSPCNTLRVELRYLQGGQVVLNGLQRISKPGRRVYVGKEKIPFVKGGMGMAILSTPKGLMTDRESRKENTGGEVLCYVW